MDALKPGHYWKTPFTWEPGSPPPAPLGELTFLPVTDDELRPLMASVMISGTDESDQYNIRRIGVEAAVQKIYDLLPRYFERQNDWWRVGQDDQGRSVGFVLPVTFKEARFWNEGRPEGTIFYMGVLPEFRGRGFGVEFVHEATRLLVAAGCWRIFCDTGTKNMPMVNAFRKAGYTESAPWQRPLE